MEPLLTPDEWLVVLPASPSPAGDSSLPAASPPAPDPAAAARDASPLTRAKLFRLLAPLPVLRLKARVSFALRPFSDLGPFRQNFYASASCAMFAGTWVFNDGRFGTRQLITGTVAYVVSNFGVTLAVLASVAAAALMERSYGLGSWRVRASGGADGPEERLAGDAKILDDDVYAGLARWLELVGAPRSDGAVDAEGATEGCKELPRLLRHDPTDKLCPCPAPGCAGQLLPRVELAEAFATLFVALGLVLALFGVPVTFGVVRAVAVAAFTVGVGLWSALRTSVFLTVQSACPS